jgi:hypothetical protein
VGLGSVFGTVRPDVYAAGDPVVVLGGVAGAPEVECLLNLLGTARGPCRRVDGAA